MAKSTSIGIREAKARLSRLVSDAQRGDEWIITDRGRPVAKLTAAELGTASLEERLDRLVARGWLEPRKKGRVTLPRPLPSGPDLQAMLQEDRNGRG
ncbi:MAG: type II toxin-antitoxin system Phd/YefM family antitoxin [Candidatus Dormibacteria bacterium]